MFNAIPIKVFTRSSVDIDKLILKFTSKHSGPEIALKILTKKEEVQGFTLPNIKAYYVAIVIKKV